MQGATHGQPVIWEVDVSPLECERLGLPESECQRNGPARRVAPAARRPQDGACLIEVQWGGGVAESLGGRVDQSGDIAVDPSALHGDLEGPGDDPVRPQDGRGGESFGKEVGVEAFEMLGL